MFGEMTTCRRILLRKTAVFVRSGTKILLNQNISSKCFFVKMSKKVFKSKNNSNCSDIRQFFLGKGNSNSNAKEHLSGQRENQTAGAHTTRAGNNLCLSPAPRNDTQTFYSSFLHTQYEKSQKKDAEPQKELYVAATNKVRIDFSFLIKKKNILFASTMF